MLSFWPRLNEVCDNPGVPPRFLQLGNYVADNRLVVQAGGRINSFSSNYCEVFLTNTLAEAIKCLGSENLRSTRRLRNDALYKIMDQN